MSDFNHALNLTHDGTLILRIPKGYKVDKVVVEEMGTDNRKEYQPTHPTPSNTLGALDCVSRQEAIEAIESLVWYHQNRNKDMVSGANSREDQPWYKSQDVYDALEKLPSAQPERLTDDDFETIRIHLNSYKEKLCNQQRWEEAEEYQRIIDRFMAFASAQPRKGKWITDNPHSEIYRYACSECHAHHRARYDFCPSCGCCMEEGDAE